MIRITPTEAAALLQRTDAPRLIDCREEDEFHLCHIEGAELIPLSRFAEIFAAKLPYLNEALILHCHHGMRSSKACEFLQAKGYTSLYNMEGGVERWSIEVDPSVPRY